MKKVLIFSLFILCLGCSSDGGDPIRSTSETNNITIISVLPLTAVEGVNTEFTIEIDYQLVDFEQGEINIGFNTDEISRFNTVHTELISRGAETLTVKTSAIPKDHEPNASFAVYANMIEYPRPTPTVVLDSDIRDIEVTPNLGFTPASIANDESDLICYTDYEEQCIQY